MPQRAVHRARRCGRRNADRRTGNIGDEIGG
jgi:hypothetical protein